MKVTWAIVIMVKSDVDMYFDILQVSEMAVSELPGNPNAVWTVKKHSDGKTYCVYFCPKGIMNIQL